jgi:hypothetical protein
MLVRTWEEYQIIFEILKNNIYPKDITKQIKSKLKNKASHFFLNDDKLFLKTKDVVILEVVPYDEKDYLKRIIYNCHIKNNYHWGIIKTANHLANFYR